MMFAKGIIVMVSNWMTLCNNSVSLYMWEKKDTYSNMHEHSIDVNENHLFLRSHCWLKLILDCTSSNLNWSFKIYIYFYYRNLLMHMCIWRNLKIELFSDYTGLFGHAMNFLQIPCQWNSLLHLSSPGSFKCMMKNPGVSQFRLSCCVCFSTSIWHWTFAL